MWRGATAINYCFAQQTARSIVHIIYMPLTVGKLYMQWQIIFVIGHQANMLVRICNHIPVIIIGIISTCSYILKITLEIICRYRISNFSQLIGSRIINVGKIIYQGRRRKTRGCSHLPHA